MKYSYITSDAGRASTGLDERQDCAVRALALSTAMSYLEAHRICADAGRRPRGIMRPSAVHAMYATHEEASWVSFLGRRPAMRPTVPQLVRDLSAGRYIFKVKGHVFAVVDGVCMDVFPKPAPRRRVEGYWTMRAVAAPKALFIALASSPQQLQRPEQARAGQVQRYMA